MDQKSTFEPPDIPGIRVPGCLEGYIQVRRKQLGTLRKIGNDAFGDPVIDSDAESSNLGKKKMSEIMYQTGNSTTYISRNHDLGRAEHQKGETVIVLKSYAPFRIVSPAEN